MIEYQIEGNSNYYRVEMFITALVTISRIKVGFKTSILKYILMILYVVYVHAYRANFIVASNAFSKSEI